MRDYVSLENLCKAAILALPMTLLSAPRILMSELHWSSLVVGYLGLTLLGGMATAWSGYAGMKGLFPPVEDMKRGFLVVLVLLVLMVPIQVLFLNPILYAKVSAAGDQDALGLLFPRTIYGAIGLILWAMSFETLFFRAAVVSFFAKLTNRFSWAIFLSVSLSVMVGYLKLNQIDMPGALYPVLFAVGFVSTVSCLVYARYGLLPAMLLAGGLTLSRYTP